MASNPIVWLESATRIVMEQVALVSAAKAIVLDENEERIEEVAGTLRALSVQLRSLVTKQVSQPSSLPATSHPRHQNEQGDFSSDVKQTHQCGSRRYESLECPNFHPAHYPTHPIQSSNYNPKRAGIHSRSQPRRTTWTNSCRHPEPTPINKRQANEFRIPLPAHQNHLAEASFEINLSGPNNSPHTPTSTNHYYTPYTSTSATELPLSRPPSDSIQAHSTSASFSVPNLDFSPARRHQASSRRTNHKTVPPSLVFQAPHPLPQSPTTDNTHLSCISTSESDIEETQRRNPPQIARHAGPKGDVRQDKPVERLRQQPTRLSVTVTEWRNFPKLWKTKLVNESGCGVLLVDLPHFITSKTQLRALLGSASLTCAEAYRQELGNNLDGIFNVSYLSISVSVRVEDIICARHQAYELDAMVDRFETSIEQERLYIANSDVATPDQRSHYLLPQQSAIYPLKCPALERTQDKIPGIHTPQVFVSHSFGTVFPLHEEDLRLAALNYNLGGAPKCWTTIPPSFHSRLESVLEKELKLKPHKRHGFCEQYIRHQNLYLTRDFLVRNEIKFSQFLQLPGQVVVTMPGTYHQGFNCGANVAEALNYADGSWNPAGVKPCWRRGREGCGIARAMVPISIRSLLPTS